MENLFTICSSEYRPFIILIFWDRRLIVSGRGSSVILSICVGTCALISVATCGRLTRIWKIVGYLNFFLAIVIIGIVVIGFDSWVLSRRNHQSGIRLGLNIEQPFLPFFRWYSLICSQPSQMVVGMVHRLPVTHLIHVLFQLFYRFLILDPISLHLLEASREFNFLYILLEINNINLPRFFQKICFTSCVKWELFLFLMHITQIFVIIYFEKRTLIWYLYVLLRELGLESWFHYFELIWQHLGFHAQEKLVLFSENALGLKLSFQFLLSLFFSDQPVDVIRFISVYEAKLIEINLLLVIKIYETKDCLEIIQRHGYAAVFTPMNKFSEV